MVSVQKSRFALLNIDDDNSDDESSTKIKDNKNGQSQNAAAKKKNRKKKKVEQVKMENDELRSMAFGKGSGRNRTVSSHSASDKGPNDKQWEQWKKMDEEFAADTYEKSLQEALLASKLEFEQNKVHSVASSGDVNGNVGGNKKGKKKKKEPKTMSLDQFNQTKIPPKPVEPGSEESDFEEPLPPKPEIKTEVSNPDPTFFDNVEKDVSKILQKEKLQEQYKQQYAAESVLSHKHKDDLASKDKEIEVLKKSNSDLKADLTAAKERSKQLCLILAEAEMKTKRQIVEELQEVKRLNAELTQEVGELNENLEKERSKVHQLTTELSKMKGGKHGASNK